MHANCLRGRFVVVRGNLVLAIVQEFVMFTFENCTVSLGHIGLITQTKLSDMRYPVRTLQGIIRGATCQLSSLCVHYCCIFLRCSRGIMMHLF